MLDTLTRQSPAKINLTLRVLGRRPDGFHEVESLVVPIGLSDTVTLSPRDDGAITLTCDDPAIPTDESNLAMRAARALLDAVNATGASLRTAPREPSSCGCHITLNKQIPPGAGLGGGSSNAATTLLLLNELWGLGLTLRQLAEIGASIGSDVPLFIHREPCILRGRGELIEPARIRLHAHALLILPQIQCATASVYSAWTSALAHADRPSLETTISHADRADRLMPLLYNDLEPAAFATYPDLAELAGALRRELGRPVCMSGSGSTLFSLFDDRDAAVALGRRCGDKLGVRTHVDCVPGVGSR